VIATLEEDRLVAGKAAKDKAGESRHGRTVTGAILPVRRRRIGRDRIGVLGYAADALYRARPALKAERV
jgi:hypothetical protein